MAQPTLIYIGISGTVVALDRGTGQEIWRADLKGSDFVNVAMADGDLYATAKGELFCLDPGSGRIRWQNPLKGLGRGLITIATAGGQQSVVMKEKRQREEAAAAAGAAG
ncbi:MAG TPA: PQQ-binding-like beta-propeller repeat protein [Bryobacteraceae bacterium]|jgi:outer membrane protein assembly factor BamB